jgi:hypothetical protein
MVKRQIRTDDNSIVHVFNYMVHVVYNMFLHTHTIYKHLVIECERRYSNFFYFIFHQATYHTILNNPEGRLKYLWCHIF